MQNDPITGTTTSDFKPDDLFVDEAPTATRNINDVRDVLGDGRRDGVEVTGGLGLDDGDPVITRDHGEGADRFRSRTFFVSNHTFVQVEGPSGWSQPVFVPTVDDIAQAVAQGIESACETIASRAESAGFVPVATPPGARRTKTSKRSKFSKRSETTKRSTGSRSRR